jgi:hypothetical protein
MGKRIAALEPDHIVAVLEELPEPLKQEALAQFSRPAPAVRHGSATFERKMHRMGRPELAVTEHDRRNMARLVANRASYRVVERVYHLEEAEGMDVYRCVKGVLKRDRNFARELIPLAKRNGVKLPKVK